MGLDPILKERYKHDSTDDRRDGAEHLIMSTRIYTVKSLKLAKVKVADNSAGEFKPEPYYLMDHDKHLEVYVDAEASELTMEVELARDMALWFARRLKLRPEMREHLQMIILADPSRIEAYVTKAGFAMRRDDKEYFSTFLGAQTIKHQARKSTCSVVTGNRFKNVPFLCRIGSDFTTASLTSVLWSPCKRSPTGQRT